VSKKITNVSNHNSGRFTTGQCNPALHHTPNVNRCQAVGNMLRFWLIMTVVLASSMATTMLCVGAASLFRDQDDLLVKGKDEHVIWPIPFLRTFLEQTNDISDAWDQTESMVFEQVGGSFNAVFFFNTVWAVLFDFWLVGIVFFMMMHGHCAHSIPAYWYIILYVGGIIISGGLTLLYGWNRYTSRFVRRYHVDVANGPTVCCGRFFDGQCAVHGLHSDIRAAPTSVLMPTARQQQQQQQRQRLPQAPANVPPRSASQPHVGHGLVPTGK
jgi:hypothetical protein